MDTLKRTERNVGIELLRIVSMFMIVVIHCNGHGGIIDNVKLFSPKSNAVWILEAFVYVAVDVFAIVCGYVNINSRKNKLPRAIELWFEAFFYSAGITAVFLLASSKTIGKKIIISSLFPVSGVMYWYFSAYFCMMLFLPLINKFINCLSKKQHLLFIIFGTTIFGVYGRVSIQFSDYDIFSVSEGYSFLWLSFVYTIGAYFKIYEDDFKSVKKTVWLSIYCGCSILTWLSKVVIDNLQLKVFGIDNISEYFSRYLYIYISPLYVLSAISLLMMFLNLHIKRLKKGIISVSSVSFGVYLISEHPVLRNIVLEKKLIFLTNMPWYEMIVFILLSAVIIYVGCTIIDYVRKYLFKLIRIRELSEKISASIMLLGNKTFQIIYDRKKD